MRGARIGYAGDPGKWARLKWTEFVEYAKSKGVNLIYIDISKPIEPQGPFDLIVHKIVPESDGYHPELSPEVQNFMNFCRSHAEIPLLDGFEAVEATYDRERLQQQISEIQWPSDLRVSPPRSIILQKSDHNSIIAATKAIKFPIFAKPKATGPDQFHQLLFTTSPKGLEGFFVPSVIQEYVNHSGIVYKAYTLGDILHVEARPSTRDIAPGEELSILFDSHSEPGSNELWTQKRDLKKVPIPMERLQRVSKILRESLKMTLMGFDILIDKEDNFWLVDVNYFPGYKNVEHLWDLFLQFFEAEMAKRRK